MPRPRRTHPTPADDRPAAASAPDPGPDRVPAPSDDAIHARIVASILDQRLAPGTRLAEDRLGAVFGVSRTRIRQVLIRLAGEQLVTLVPHRGARVAEPTPAEAREVFALRRLVEPTIVAGFVEQADAAARSALQACIVAEEAAREAGDRAAAIGLAGRFHLHLAQHAGNATLARWMHELVSRTALVLMRYAPGDFGERPVARGLRVACECQEHRALAAAIRLRDAAAAGRLMVEHLRRLESQLEFEPRVAAPPDLASLLRA
jgi:DNA-binding GntR family transcriptional regulator